MNEIPKTIFCDIDGVLFEHPGSYDKIYNLDPKVILGTYEKIQEWHLKGYMIILTTSRLPSMKKLTIAQLNRAKIPYHHLIMGINRGCRIIINDKKPNNDMCVAQAIELKRDNGIKNVEI